MPKAQRSNVSRAKIGFAVCGAVAIGLTAATMIAPRRMPDERVAANRAEQFALAIVTDDFGYAYDLLDPDLQATQRPEEFIRSVKELHPKEKPASIVAVGFRPVQRGSIDVFLEGERNARHFYYRFRMSGSSRTGYRVAAFERSSSPHPSTASRIPSVATADLRSPPANARLLLVAIDANRRHVEAVAAPFRERLGLPVQILPVMDPDREGVVESRNQLVAEVLVDQLRRRYQHVGGRYCDWGSRALTCTSARTLRGDSPCPIENDPPQPSCPMLEWIHAPLAARPMKRSFGADSSRWLRRTSAS